MEYFNESLIDKIFENNLQDTLKYIIASLDGISAKVHQNNRIGVDTKKAYANTHLLVKKRKKRGEKSIPPALRNAEGSKHAWPGSPCKSVGWGEGEEGLQRPQERKHFPGQLRLDESGQTLLSIGV